MSIRDALNGLNITRRDLVRIMKGHNMAQLRADNFSVFDLFDTASLLADGPDWDNPTYIPSAPELSEEEVDFWIEDDSFMASIWGF